MSINLKFSAASQVKSAVNIGPLAGKLRAKYSAVDLTEALLQLQQAVNNAERILDAGFETKQELISIASNSNPQKVTSDYQSIKIYDANGTVVSEVNVAFVNAPLYQVNGTKVVGAQGASISNVSGTAGATYTSTEQTLLNSTVTTVNNILARIRASGGHGLIA